MTTEKTKATREQLSSPQKFKLHKWLLRHHVYGGAGEPLHLKSTEQHLADLANEERVLPGIVISAYQIAVARKLDEDQEILSRRDYLRHLNSLKVEHADPGKISDLEARILALERIVAGLVRDQSETPIPNFTNAVRNGAEK